MVATFESLDTEYFLGEGEYTKRDGAIRQIAQKVKQYASEHSLSLLDSLSGYLEHKFVKIDGRRGRSASQIINDRTMTGCSDRGIVFLALARELGFPARYVETFNEHWLSEPPSGRIEGHIFADVFVDGEWKIYEPKAGFTKDGKYSLSHGQYIEVGKGLDFGSVYIKENGVYRKEPASLAKSLDEAIKIFKPSHLRFR